MLIAYVRIQSNQINLPAYLIHMFAFFSFLRVQTNWYRYVQTHVSIHIHVAYIVFSVCNFVSITSFLGPIHLRKVIEIHGEINQLEVDGEETMESEAKKNQLPTDYRERLGYIIHPNL